MKFNPKAFQFFLIRHSNKFLKKINQTWKQAIYQKPRAKHISLLKTRRRRKKLARGSFTLGVIGPAKTVAREKKVHLWRLFALRERRSSLFQSFSFFIFDITLQVLRHQIHRQQARGGKLGTFRHIIFAFMTFLSLLQASAEYRRVSTWFSYFPLCFCIL